MQLVVILAPGEILVLNAAHHAIAAVVHDQQGDVHLFLRHGRQFPQAQRQTAIAHQPHHLALRVGDRGADRHRQPHADSTGQRVNVAQRRDRAEQTAAPDAAGYGDIAHQQSVLRQRGVDGVVEFGVFTGLLTQRTLRLLHRPRDLGIPLGVDLLAGAQPRRQRGQQRRTVAIDLLIRQVVAVGRRRIDINLHQRARQRQRPGAGFITAQP